MIRWNFLVAGGMDNYHLSTINYHLISILQRYNLKNAMSSISPIIFEQILVLDTHARKAHFSSRWRLSWTTKCIAWNGEADVFSGSSAADGGVWQMADGS